MYLVSLDRQVQSILSIHQELYGFFFPHMLEVEDYYLRKNGEKKYMQLVVTMRDARTKN